MKKELLHARILILLAALCLVIGFILASSSPDKVFASIVFYMALIILLAFSLVPLIKYNKLFKEESGKGRVK